MRGNNRADLYTSTGKRTLMPKRQAFSEKITIPEQRRAVFFHSRAVPFSVINITAYTRATTHYHPGRS